MTHNRNVLQHLQQILCDYQEDYEGDKENVWKKEFIKSAKRVEKITNQLSDSVSDYAYFAQNLGFVQGMNFALDLMKISGKDKDHEVLEKLIDSIENMKW